MLAGQALKGQWDNFEEEMTEYWSFYETIWQGLHERNQQWKDKTAAEIKDCKRELRGLCSNVCVDITSMEFPVGSDSEEEFMQGFSRQKDPYEGASEPSQAPQSPVQSPTSPVSTPVRTQARTPSSARGHSTPLRTPNRAQSATRSRATTPLTTKRVTMAEDFVQMFDAPGRARSASPARTATSIDKEESKRIRDIISHFGLSVGQPLQAFYNAECRNATMVNFCKSETCFGIVFEDDYNEEDDHRRSKGRRRITRIKEEDNDEEEDEEKDDDRDNKDQG